MEEIIFVIFKNFKKTLTAIAIKKTWWYNENTERENKRNDG